MTIELAEQIGQLRAKIQSARERHAASLAREIEISRETMATIDKFAAIDEDIAEAAWVACKRDRNKETGEWRWTMADEAKREHDLRVGFTTAFLQELRETLVKIESNVA